MKKIPSDSQRIKQRNEKSPKQRRAGDERHKELKKSLW